VAQDSPLRSIVRRWIPNALQESLRPYLGLSVYYKGDYPDWSAAQKHSNGYDADVILEKVKQSVLRVKCGEFAFERDSVLFHRIQFSFPVFAGLLLAAGSKSRTLSVLDYGGSLGTSYFQCRPFFSGLGRVAWGIVEQLQFVRCGNEVVADKNLQFFESIEACVKKIRPNVALLSGVLQYVADPFRVLKEIVGYDVPVIVIDRTPYSDLSEHHITVQHVPPRIYPANYPCWIFSRSRFLERLPEAYEIMAEFDGRDGCGKAGRIRFTFGGMILRKRD
jgi:putative methyltransferase (TIGR04325 family)